MPIYQDKRSKALFYQFQYRKVTYKEYLPKGISKREAEKIETKKRHEVFSMSQGVVSNTQFEVFLTNVFMPHVKRKGIEAYKKARSIMRLALPIFKGKSIKNIRAADVENFMAHLEKLPTIHGRARKPATIRRQIDVLSSFFSLAVKNDVADYNPCSRVDKPKFDNIDRSILSWADQEKFLNAFESDWARDICELVLNTGLRQNDVMNLTRFQVHLDEGVIRLVQRKTKHPVTIPINDAAERILRANWKDEGVLFPSPKNGGVGHSVRKAVAGAVKRAGIPKITIRRLRTTYCTRLEEMGIPATAQAKLLGHKGLRSVHRYAQGTEILKDAVQAISTQNLRTADLKESTKPVSIENIRVIGKG